MENKLNIEDGIPLPFRGCSISDALRSLKVGQSVLIPGKVTGEVGGYIRSARLKTLGKYTSKTVDGGCRVWRVE